MSIDVQDRLKTMNSAWNEAPSEGGYEPPPDGDYQAVVERFDWFEAKSPPEHLFLKTELRVTNGEHSGAPVSCVHDVEDPDRLGWLKGHLRNLGLEIEDFTTLEQQLVKLVGVPVEIRIKRTRKNDTVYTNVYCNKRLGDAGTTPAAAGKAGNSDDEIPF